jgi:hypothetical protein
MAGGLTPVAAVGANDEGGLAAALVVLLACLVVQVVRLR